MLDMRREQSAQLAHGLDNEAVRRYFRACPPFTFDGIRQQESCAPSTNLEKARLGHAARVVHAASQSHDLTDGGRVNRCVRTCLPFTWSTHDSAQGMLLRVHNANVALTRPCRNCAVTGLQSSKGVKKHACITASASASAKCPEEAALRPYLHKSPKWCPVTRTMLLCSLVWLSWNA